MLTVDVLIETTGSVGVGARVQTGGCGDNYAAGGYFFDISEAGMFLSSDSSLSSSSTSSSSTYILVGDWKLYKAASVIKLGTTTFSSNKFYTIGLTANGTSICVTIDKALIACMTDATYTYGFASIGSGWNCI